MTSNEPSKKLMTCNHLPIDSEYFLCENSLGETGKVLAGRGKAEGDQSLRNDSQDEFWKIFRVTGIIVVVFYQLL